jgi:hypothetical protein
MSTSIEWRERDHQADDGCLEDLRRTAARKVTYGVRGGLSSRADHPFIPLTQALAFRFSPARSWAKQPDFQESPVS